ncbi:hypothetical protein TGPRC2_290925 [Toxoplasma gondii TgCatPRC2]|uniref:Uncharacterized protein n=3 Tax=Toxoplasma gondii TaxID=5811 RepID=A0A151HK40_TOXGO|nr:hypothetical protein TGME49_290925 [Toxoplasma gondii ME49]EPT28052.1 hypothetical protein TGME49_290925 [Toxoplasma gondii ME49]KYF45011.1 hypothetical protein TGARI_290925 [Toxoplasma gondii ARI]KYK69684.1 hypothetical protein TGPRC2_290925 [Toxoplasma gondii TgCatPRC2]|eukprot:XP_018636450.1 hypothetical protein TGME49_290925 [Toxoplasma gondii ME49]
MHGSYVPSLVSIDGNLKRRTACTTHRSHFLDQSRQYSNTTASNSRVLRVCRSSLFYRVIQVVRCMKVCLKCPVYQTVQTHGLCLRTCGVSNHTKAQHNLHVRRTQVLYVASQQVNVQRTYARLQYHTTEIVLSIQSSPRRRLQLD